MKSVTIVYTDIHSIDSHFLIRIVDHLSTTDQIQWGNITLETEKKRFLASRLLTYFYLKNHFPAMVNQGIPIHKDELGKPYIQGFSGYSISHSENMVMIAISKGLKVGIDIQKIYAIDHEAMLSTMNEEEKKYFDKLSFSHQQRWFFKRWCQKEALLKAEGMGLGVEPDQIIIHGLKGKLREGAQAWYFSPSAHLEFSDEYAMSICTNTDQANVSYLKFRT